MTIEWKVAKSKKKVRGRDDREYKNRQNPTPRLYEFEVKRTKGGWRGVRKIEHLYEWGSGTITHKIGPFKEKRDCIAAMETLHSLLVEG